MMRTKKTNRWESMKALVVLPLAAIAVVAFASPEVAEVENEVVAESQQLVQAVEQQVTGRTETMATPAGNVPMSAEANAVETAPADTAKSEKTYDVVETMPEYSGGTGEMMKYLAKNIRYPKEMEKQNVQGRVIISFVVKKNGEIADAQVVKSVHPQLDAEALRIVNGMPNWTPGMQGGKPVAVKFTLPVTFRLQGDDNKKAEGDTKVEGKNMMDDIVVIGYADNVAKNNVNLYVQKKSDADVLVVIDGKEMPDMKSLESINPDNIESVTVMKDPKETSKYGVKAKNGVILVTMKKK